MTVRHTSAEKNISVQDWKCLADIPAGTTVVLAMPHAERQLCRRLAQLGLRPGMKVTVAQRTSGGGRVVRSGAARYAIDRETLKSMEVA